VKQSSKTVPSDPRIEQIIDLFVSIVTDELERRLRVASSNGETGLADFP
jgi:hypothetical protein